jgi:hypothetical protein
VGEQLELGWNVSGANLHQVLRRPDAGVGTHDHDRAGLHLVDLAYSLAPSAEPERFYEEITGCLAPKGSSLQSERRF